MQTRIWLMRHAETATPHLFHGAESDIGLSELGVAQAKAAAEVYAQFRPDVIVSSGMLRARLTAAPIVEMCQVPYEIELDLHERKVGALSGTPNDATGGVWPETLQRWVRGELDYAPAGSESFEAIRSRVVPAFERVATRHAGKSVVIVAHGIVCRVLLLSILEGWSPEDWTKLGRIPNMAVSELIHWAGTWQAVRTNEVFPEVAALSAMPDRRS
ncbi:histidine phosphatase family protein [Tuwongella immobilis]|uniref:Histidine phosphatase family protein n=1 Tax=Tuwongella immobilis TaxID=692036 RepID=A0A6C2YLG3_9BACT|nr:histidine phosphatase family protein [Tuwongella immobilis]VIP02266.1 phosphoglycerate mutase : Fructose-2,6-bisphosphatase OS=Singulisphaera acidiphila (strain ATCC BAA-1392 / DSM 18658 / VKM B-2454 / MOB10) GN=Sinac_1498 PE=4 SV=1: His_Phos_1 [Tuwongella immobilis]VTS00885.1 phosphoglycerate mutase : Fructose-2,6-bisphosphatase OS=Singulisphaera acidiphila (strain ATCC BAA-1392 / DSM 18658 / VKM B-2454 / MOB10) GN=Sinac_1498 PE=4 SV=1: His_Phos_1 [Tuwongella immobilis]